MASKKSILETRLKKLTDWEREVLGMVADGLTNLEIAEVMGIGLRTVELYRHNAAETLKAETHAELVRLIVMAVELRCKSAPEITPLVIK